MRTCNDEVLVCFACLETLLKICCRIDFSFFLISSFSVYKSDHLKSKLQYRLLHKISLIFSVKRTQHKICPLNTFNKAKYHIVNYRLYIVQFISRNSITETLCPIYFKYMQLSVYQLYLNEAVENKVKKG